MISSKLLLSSILKHIPARTQVGDVRCYRIGLRFKSTRPRSLEVLEMMKKKEGRLVLRSQQGKVGRASDAIEGTDIQSIYNRVKPITPNDSYVSCTTFDTKGNITEVSKKYPKMRFLKDNNLFPRDLRKIDTSSIEVVPVIMVRSNNCILVNLLYVKAIIKKDSVLVFDTSAPRIARQLGMFMYDLEMKLKLPSSGLNYEFRVLETILVSVMSYLEAELKTHIKSCGTILSELEDQVDRKNLQELLIDLKKISSFYQKTALIRDVLEDLLDNDEDLAGMYLSEPPKLGEKEEDDTTDVEMILESYYKQCDEFVQQAGSLINDIKVTEDIVNIILDTNRNSLMLFELKITVYTLGFTAATLLPAFYGMNLKNFIEESHIGFAMVIAFSIIQGLVITMINFKKLHKVQKLTMMDGSNFPSLNHQVGALSSTGKQRWYSRLLFGSKCDKVHKPTNYEKDVIWRMINDDKPVKQK